MIRLSQRHHSSTGSRARRLTSLLSAALAALLLFFALPVAADVGQEEISLPDISEVNCASYFVYDRTSGQAVISKDQDESIFPASMTKIMTAALALEYLKTDQVLTASDTAIGAITPNSTKMGLIAGEQTTVSELLYGLLLPSGNDAANVLAEGIVDASGYTDPANPDRTKLELFADIMNKKAAELGLSHTHFMNANGLHDDNHYTTAADLAAIFDYALQSDDFRTVISSPTHVFKATNKHSFDAWYFSKNTNCLLTDPWILGADTKVAKVIGGKTGTTIIAGTGMTLLAVDKNGDELITVICGIPYENASRLTSYAASVLNAGAAACFEKDPTVRIEGNVMDYEPNNAPAGLGPTGSFTPTSTPAPEPTAAETTAADTDTTAQPQPTGAAAADGSSSPLVRFFVENTAVCIVLIVFLVLVTALIVLYFAANRQSRIHRRSKRNDRDRIRRI